jgi:sec-independent protein translocase protein TatA
MFGRLGAPEIVLILVVILLLFGAKRLPDMARSFGQSMRILKSETKAMHKDDTDDPGTVPAAALQSATESRHPAQEEAAPQTPHGR